MSEILLEIPRVQETYKAYQLMKAIVEAAEEHDDWDNKWELFWEVNGMIKLNIYYSDPDTGEREDMMARYNAVKDYVESLNLPL